VIECSRHSSSVHSWLSGPERLGLRRADDGQRITVVRRTGEALVIDVHSHALLVEGLLFGDAVRLSSPPLLASVVEALHAGGSPWIVRRLANNTDGDGHLDHHTLRDELDVVVRHNTMCLLVVLAGAVVRDGSDLGFVIARGRSGVGASWPISALAAALKGAYASQCIVVAAVEAGTEITADDVAAALATEAGAAIIAVVAASLHDHELQERPGHDRLIDQLPGPEELLGDRLHAHLLRLPRKCGTQGHRVRELDSRAQLHALPVRAGVAFPRGR